MDDPASATGLRIETEGVAPWVTSIPSVLAGITATLDGSNGFGRMGVVVLRFSEALGVLPEDAEASVVSPALWFVDLDTTPPTRVPYRVSRADDDRQLMVQPLAPLAPGHRHTVILTTDHVAADGGCVAPSPVLRGLLTGAADDPALVRVQPRYQAALDAVALDVAAVSAMTVFTTHDALGPLVAAAQDAVDDPPAWSRATPCAQGDGGAPDRCTLQLHGRDHRDDGIVQATRQATWLLDAEIWMPAERAGPVPVVMYGHGMNGNRYAGGGAWSRFGDLGVAVIALDALEHGDHPTAADDTTPDGVAFLGLDVFGPTFDGGAMRGAFTQTALDRVQLIEALAADPDVDGDGTPDLDLSRVAYVGESLGGMLGPATLALSARFDAGVFEVGGGHLIRFVTDTALVSAFRPVLEDLAGGPGALERLLAVGQAAIDSADPAVLAAHVLQDRLVGGAPPHLLHLVAEGDWTVPPSTGRALARALGLPHVPPVATPVALLQVSPAAPIQGNADGRTQGFFQYDVVLAGDALVTATHMLPGAREARYQTRTFVQSWLDDGVPTIVDPYAELEISR